jgi:hypothetical protein
MDTMSARQKHVDSTVQLNRVLLSRPPRVAASFIFRTDFPPEAFMGWDHVLKRQLGIVSFESRVERFSLILEIIALRAHVSHNSITIAD